MNTWRLLKHRPTLKLVSILAAIAFLLSNSNIALAKLPKTAIDKPNKKGSLFEEPDAPGGPSHVWPFRHSPQKAPLSFDVEKVSIPQELGTVKERFKGDADKTIVYIQDLHAHYEAQRQLAQILDFLISKFGLRIILVEAGVTDNDFSYIRYSFPKETRERKAGELLKEGVINGETYIDIAGNYDLKFQGVEDAGLYDKNMEAFLKVDSFREEGLRLAQLLRNISDNLKIHIFNPDLKKFDSLKKGHEAGKTKLAEYVDYLRNSQRSLSIDSKGYQNFELLCQTIELEGKIDFDKVESERTQLITRLTESCPKEDVEKILLYSLNYKQGKIKGAEFYDFLASLSQRDRNLKLSNFPNLKLYIEYVSQYDKVEAASLFAEMGELEDEVEKGFCRNADQETLRKISRNLALLEGFLGLELAPRDWRYYSLHKGEFDVRQWAKFLNLNAQRFKLFSRVPEDISVLADNFDSLEAFYETVIRRDEAFLRNSLARLDREDEDVAVLIAGGFHAENLTALFKQEGTSYLIITPRFSGEVDEERYRSTLKRTYSSRIWMPTEAAASDIAHLRDVRDADNARDLNQIHKKFGLMTFGQVRVLLEGWLPEESKVTGKTKAELLKDFDNEMAALTRMLEGIGEPRDAYGLTVAEVINGKKYTRREFGEGNDNIRIRVHQIIQDEIIAKAIKDGSLNPELGVAVTPANPTGDNNVGHIVKLIRRLANKLERAGRADAAKYLRKMLEEGRFKILNAQELIPQDGDVKGWTFPFLAHSGGQGVWLWDVLAENGQYDERTILEELGAQLGIDLVINHRLAGLFEEEKGSADVLRESEFRSLEEGAARVMLAAAKPPEAREGVRPQGLEPQAEQQAVVVADAQIFEYFKEARVYKTHRYLFAFVDVEHWVQLHEVLNKLALKEELKQDEIEFLRQRYQEISPYATAQSVWMDLYKRGQRAKISDNILLEVISDDDFIDLFARLEELERRLDYYGLNSDSNFQVLLKRFVNDDREVDFMDSGLGTSRDEEYGGYAFLDLYGHQKAPQWRRNTERMAWVFAHKLSDLAKRLGQDRVEDLRLIRTYFDKVSSEQCPSARLRTEALEVMNQLPDLPAIATARARPETRERRRTDDLLMAADRGAEDTDAADASYAGAVDTTGAVDTGATSEAELSPRRRAFNQLTFGRVIGLLKQWDVDVWELDGIMGELKNGLPEGADAYGLKVAEVMDGREFARKKWGEGYWNVRVRIQQILNDEVIKNAHYSSGRPKEGMAVDVTPENVAKDANVERIVILIEGLAEKLEAAKRADAAKYLRQMLKEGRFKILNAKGLIPQKGKIEGWIFPFLAHSGGQGVWLWDVLTAEREYDESTILEELGGQLGIDLVYNHRLVEIFQEADDKVAALQESEFRAVEEKAAKAVLARRRVEVEKPQLQAQSETEVFESYRHMRMDYRHRLLFAFVEPEYWNLLERLLNKLAKGDALEGFERQAILDMDEQLGPYRAVLEVWMRLYFDRERATIPPGLIIDVLADGKLMELFEKLESGLYNNPRFDEISRRDYEADGKPPTETPGLGPYDYKMLSNPIVLRQMARTFVLRVMTQAKALPGSTSLNWYDDLQKVREFYGFITSERCRSNVFKVAAAELKERFHIPTVREFARRRRDDLSMSAGNSGMEGESFTIAYGGAILSQGKSYVRQGLAGEEIYEFILHLYGAMLAIQAGKDDEEIIQFLLKPLSEEDAGEFQTSLEAAREVYFDIGRLAGLIERAADSIGGPVLPAPNRLRVMFTTGAARAITDLRTLAMLDEAQLEQTAAFSFSEKEQEVYALMEFFDLEGLASSGVEVPEWVKVPRFTIGEIRIFLSQVLGDQIILNIPSGEIPGLLTQERALLLMEFITEISSDADLSRFMTRAYRAVNESIKPPISMDVVSALRVNGLVAGRRQHYHRAINSFCRKIAVLGLQGKVKDYQGQDRNPEEVVEEIIDSFSRAAIVRWREGAYVTLILSFDFSQGDSRILKVGNLGLELRDGEKSVGILHYDEKGRLGPVTEIADEAFCKRLYRSLNEIVKEFPDSLHLILSDDATVSYFYRHVGISMVNQVGYSAEEGAILIRSIQETTGVSTPQLLTTADMEGFDEAREELLDMARLAIMVVRKGLNPELSPLAAYPAQDNAQFLAALAQPNKPADLFIAMGEEVSDEAGAEDERVAKAEGIAEAGGLADAEGVAEAQLEAEAISTQAAQGVFMGRIKFQKDLLAEIGKLGASGAQEINRKRRLIRYVDGSLPNKLRDSFIEKTKGFLKTHRLSQAVTVGRCGLKTAQRKRSDDVEVLYVIDRKRFKETYEAGNKIEGRVLVVDNIDEGAFADDLSSVLPPEIVALSLGLVCTDQTDIEQQSSMAMATRELYAQTKGGAQVGIDDIGAIVNRQNDDIYHNRLQTLTVEAVAISDDIGEALKVLEYIWSQA